VVYSPRRGLKSEESEPKLTRLYGSDLSKGRTEGGTAQRRTGLKALTPGQPLLQKRDGDFPIAIQINEKNWGEKKRVELDRTVGRARRIEPGSRKGGLQGGQSNNGWILLKTTIRKNEGAAGAAPSRGRPNASLALKCGEKTGRDVGYTSEQSSNKKKRKKGEFSRSLSRKIKAARKW